MKESFTCIQAEFLILSLKINMEQNSEGLEDDFPLQMDDF